MVEPTKYQLAILTALMRLGKHVYGGTVPAKEKARRRAAGKVAKNMRKKNRLTA